MSGKILIDSGAHSFQHGAKADFGAYTDRYCDFVRRNTNNPKVEGFFEMDIDNVIGIEGVERLSHFFFGWTMVQCLICSLTGAVIETVFEIAFSPIGYKICKKWKEEGVGDEYLKEFKK